MAIFAVKLENSGRILIPVEIRRKLGLQTGEDVLLSEEGDHLQILGSRKAAVMRVQERMKRHEPQRILSEELIAERRAEAAEETQH
jgi:AbrB family looped-hinge helix DNA binding protein